MNPSETPTVPITAVLFTYNQEAVVEEAVRSIFEQSLAPDEIILSDDGSSDRTFAVLERLAGSYDGPGEVRVRRSESNKGWFAHMNACMAEAGHLHVLVFAGDDVSKSNRVEAFWQVIQANPGAKLIWSAMERMSPTGELSGKSMGITAYNLKRLRGVGASQSWHRDLFTHFGDLPQVEAAEDVVLPFRATLLEGLHYIPQPLVNWRDRDYRELCDEQLTHYYTLRASKFRKNAAAIMLADLKKHQSKVAMPEVTFSKLKKRLKRLKQSADAEYRVISEKQRLGRFAVFLGHLPALGWKAGRRIFHNEVLRLPSYLESSYPRTLIKLLPPAVGIAAAMMVLLTLPFGIPVGALSALLTLFLAMEFTRLGLRYFAKLRWG